MGFPDSVSDGVRVDNFEVVTVGTSDDTTLGLFYNAMLGVADYCKLVK